MSIQLATETCEVPDGQNGSICRKPVTFQEGEDPAQINFASRCATIGGTSEICCNKEELDLIPGNNSGIIGISVYDDVTGELSGESRLCPANIVSECNDFMNDEIYRTGINSTRPFRECMLEKCPGARNLTHYEACKLGLLGLSPAEISRVSELTEDRQFNLIKDCEPECPPPPPTPPRSTAAVLVDPAPLPSDIITPLAGLTKEELVDEFKVRFGVFRRSLTAKFLESKLMQGLIILVFAAVLMVILSFNFTRGVFLLILLAIILVNVYFINEVFFNNLADKASETVRSIEVISPIVERVDQLNSFKNLIL